MKTLLIALSLLLLLGPVACIGGQGSSIAEAASDKPRETSPAVSASELAELVSENTRFAFDLYQALKHQDGNLFYSPFSISAALAMTYAGARNETERQMASTLRFTLPQTSLHPAFNALDLALASRGQGAKGKDGEGFRLKIANALWGQKDYQFLADFLDVLAENYGAGMRLLDFRNQPEPSRITINDWVEDRTEDRIKDLIPQGVIDEATRLVLTNAIYFNAAWLHAFDDRSTADGQFHLLDGSQVTVPMMHQTESFGYATGDGYVAVELPYDGEELSMVILLPGAGKLRAFESLLSAELLATILGDIENENVALAMPRFEFKSELRLRETLAAMGMPVAFSGMADFSGMTGNRDLQIAEVLHQAFVSVDESGTEAAAATAVVMRDSAAPQQPVQVTLDRPFVFLIRDVETGAVLFAGRVVNPVA
ncbi:MAG: serine protease [Chloroflexi bacterium RBG_13_54_8]|nr:MAG: serine protease [Chloroflexi bacterium RBG_13_54_8]